MPAVFDRIRFNIPAASLAAIVVNHSLGIAPAGGKLRAAGGTTTGAVTGRIRRSIGAFDGTRQFCYGSDVSNNAVTATAISTARTDSCVLELDDPTDVVLGKAGFTSSTSTTVTFTPSVVFTAAMEVELDLFAGGTGFYVDAFTLPNDTNDISRTGAGFTPNFCEVYYAATGAPMDSLGGRASLSIGAATSAAQQWCALVTREDVLSDYTFRAFRTGSIGLFDNTLGGAFLDEIALLAFQSGGGIFDRVTGNGARPMCVVWMAGYSPVVGTIAARTTAGTIDVATPGVDAGYLFLASCPPSIASNTATVEAGEAAYGSAVSTGAGKSGCSWFGDVNNEPLNPNVTDPLGHQSDNLIYERFNRTGTDAKTQIAAIAVQTMAAGGKAVLNQTVADIATLIGYVAMGNPSSSGGIRRRQLLDRARRNRWEPELPRMLSGVFAAPFITLTGVSQPPSFPVSFSVVRRRLNFTKNKTRRTAFDPRIELTVFHSQLRAQPFKTLTGGGAGAPNPADLPLASRRVHLRDRRTGRDRR